MRTALICHYDAPLNRYGIARWLASFSELVAIVVIHEPRGRLLKRLRHEVRRIGVLRLLDVFAFRVYYHWFLAEGDRRWVNSTLDALAARYPAIPVEIPIHHTSNPNDDGTREFLTRAAPELTVARCKVLLREEIYEIPNRGTFVFHPGICPEYRNAHGCFWALAKRDMDRVGMTLLRIDEGVDTGPVYGYFTYAFDEVEESHTVIQNRVVLDNLDAIRTRLLEALGGEREPIDTSRSRSAVWGQPWLSAYLRWKWNARRRARESCHPAVS